MTQAKIIPPGVISLEFDTEQMANVSALTMHKMLELIAQTKQVILRRAVTVTMDRDFETIKNKWIVSCRFYITDGPEGIVKTAPVDNELFGYL